MGERVPPIMPMPTICCSCRGRGNAFVRISAILFSVPYSKIPPPPPAASARLHSPVLVVGAVRGLHRGDREGKEWMGGAEEEDPEVYPEAEAEGARAWDPQ